MADLCSLCQEGTLSPWGSKNGFQLVRCVPCSAIIANIPFSAEPRPSLYDAIYAGGGPAPPRVVRQVLVELVAGAESLRDTGKWLDVGFGGGTLLEAAAAAGWNCHGTEVSSVALEDGRRRGWTVATALENPAFKPDEFDVITFIEVIEHVREAESLLQGALRLLRPGGLLYVTTPNAASLNQRLLGREWSIIAPPDHRTIWTAHAMRRTLARLGCDEIHVRTSGLNPSDLLDKIRGRPTRARHRVTTAYAINTALSKSSPRRWIKVVANGLLALFGQGDTLKIRAFRGR